MHRSPSTQLRTPEFPRYAVASSLCCLALSFSHLPGQPRELTDDLLLRKHERGHSFPLKHLFNVEAEDLLLALLW
jgi:hypothetical protein